MTVKEPVPRTEVATDPLLVSVLVGLLQKLVMGPTVLYAPRNPSATVELLTVADKLREKAGDSARRQAERHRAEAAAAGTNAQARGDALAKAAEAEKQASSRFKKAK